MRKLASEVRRSEVFFMAGAITFNVLIALIPLLLLVAGIAGFTLSARYGQSTGDLLGVVFSYFPAIEGDVNLVDTVASTLEGLIDGRTTFSIIGALTLLWISTRLIGTLRVVLRTIFALEQDRGILAGKFFDLQVVLVGGMLLLLNVGVTLGARALEAFGVDLFRLGTTGAVVFHGFISMVVGFGSAWILFFLLYRYLPAGRVPFPTAAVGATFTAIMHEVLKEGFALYVTSLADYSTAYGNLAVVAILFFWIYYSAVVFILGGHVAHVFALRRGQGMVERAEQGNGGIGTGAALFVLAALFALPAGASAQSFAPFGGNGNGAGGGLLETGESVVMASRALERDFSIDRPLVEHDGVYVVVHVAENRVFVLNGIEVVWSAPAGTGTGFFLQGQGQEWTFTTPVGMFQVLRKEKDPIWEAPDWYYVRQGIRIPAFNHPSRFIPNTLGTSALFLGDGIAIHGTDRPDLLLNPDPEARRISAGCIRLTNEAARQLYHYVDVGTPVLIF